MNTPPATGTHEDLTCPYCLDGRDDAVAFGGVHGGCDVWLCNGDLMTFWRVLRDHPADLERAAALTPHSKAEYAAARNLDVPDDIERARRVWVQLTQARGSRLGVRTGWRFTRGTNRMALARYFEGYLARIAPAAERLKSVTLELRSALEVIATYDRPDVLFYVDPPYLASTRHGAQYADEFMSVEDHQTLLGLLTQAQAAVVLSGYDSALYREVLDGWTVRRMATTAMTGEPRTEIVWCNFTPPAQLELDFEADARRGVVA